MKNGTRNIVRNISQLSSCVFLRVGKHVSPYFDSIARLGYKKNASSKSIPYVLSLLATNFKQVLRIFLWLLCFVSPLDLSADEWRFLSNDQEALQCRLNLIEQAEHEILLSSFIFRDDKIGKSVLYLAVKAATERGVQVKIIVDSYNYKIDKRLRAYVASQGVELRKFQVKGLGRFRLFRGLHEKMLLIDGKWLITGGRNIEEKYFNLSTDFNFKDLDVLIEGAFACSEARNHFFDTWNNHLVSYPLKFNKRHIRSKEWANNTLKKAFDQLSLYFTKGYHLKLDWFKIAYTTDQPIRFIHDDLFEKKGHLFIKSDIKDRKCTIELIQMMGAAKSHIVIQNPYFIPTRTWTKFFKNAQKRGIKTTLLVNSSQTNDMVVYQAAYLNRRKELLQLGIEIWEYQGPKKLHMKSIVIDDRISIVGSYNIHFPSEALNTEVAVVVDDEIIARHHLDLIEKNLVNAIPINKDNKPEFIPHHTFSKPACKRRVSIFLARYTIAFWFNRFL